MRRNLTAVMLATLMTFPVGRVEAQVSNADVMAEFSSLSDAVVRIRTVSDLEYSPIDQRVGSAVPGSRPYSVDGTGIVVGQMMSEGNLEYLILTNHHVADASNYVLEEEGYLRVNPANTMAQPRIAEESYLMAEERGEITGADVKLVELVRRVQGDMTLMRTVGAKAPMATFTGQIGYVDDEIVPGARVLTSGFPWGRKKIAAVGSVLAVDYPHDLGMAHEDFVVDLPVEPGQSGGPLFLIEESPEGTVAFRLIGLIHAKDRERNYGVPYRLWEESLEEFPAELQGRLVR